MRWSVVALLLLGACSERSSNPPREVLRVDAGQVAIMLSVTAPRGELVRTRDGIWLRAASGTQDDAIEIAAGETPAAAERSFISSFVEHPACARGVKVRSAGVEIVRGALLDRVELSCAGRWSASLWFNIDATVAARMP